MGAVRIDLPGRLPGQSNADRTAMRVAMRFLVNVDELTGDGFHRDEGEAYWSRATVC